MHVEVAEDGQRAVEPLGENERVRVSGRVDAGFTEGQDELWDCVFRVGVGVGLGYFLAEVEEEMEEGWTGCQDDALYRVRAGFEI